MQLTVVDFARRMKVNRSTVYRWIISKTLPAPWKAKVHLTHIYITDEDAERAKKILNNYTDPNT